MFVPTPTGVQRIPVYVDASSYERFGILEKDRQQDPELNAHRLPSLSDRTS